MYAYIYIYIHVYIYISIYTYANIYIYIIYVYTHDLSSIFIAILRFNQQKCDFNYCNSNDDSNTTAG